MLSVIGRSYAVLTWFSQTLWMPIYPLCVLAEGRKRVTFCIVYWQSNNGSQHFLMIKLLFLPLFSWLSVISPGILPLMQRSKALKSKVRGGSSSAQYIHQRASDWPRGPETAFLTDTWGYWCHCYRGGAGSFCKLQQSHFRNDFSLSICNYPSTNITFRRVSFKREKE